MTLVEKDRSNFLLSNMNNPVYEAGGSAANTAYWISQLGGEAGFIGKISNDDNPFCSWEITLEFIPAPLTWLKHILLLY